MEAPESVVHRGIEGTGEAQIFGAPGNPMRAYYNRKQDAAYNQAYQAQLAKLDKEKRDKAMWDVINVEPEKAFEPFDQQVHDAAKEHRDNMVRFIEKGANPEDPKFKMYAKNGWDKVNALARKSNYLKQVITDTQKVIKENPYLRQDYYYPKIWDTYMDEKGKGKPLDQVDPIAIQNVYTNDPMGFNETKYQKDYMDGLNDNMSNYIRQRATNNGILTEDVENKWKGNLYTRDDKSPLGVKTDAKGNPILNVTPELVKSFTNSDAANRYYSAIAQQEGRDLHDVVAAKLSNNPSFQHNVKPSFSREPGWMFDYMNGGKLKPDEKLLANKVFEHIGNITNAFYSPDGERTDEASPQARAAVGHLVGTKFGASTIENATLVPGSFKPGTSKVMGKTVHNSPNDRLVLLTKSGTKGMTNVTEVDLTDEGAGATLWNHFRDSGYMGKKNIAFDQAAQELGVNPRDLYKGREYQAVQQEKDQRAVENLSKGEDFGAMTGKQYKGSVINEVTRNESFFGGFKGYTLHLADGSKVDVGKDDIDALSKIVRSKPAKPAQQIYKRADGQEFSLEDLRKKFKYTDAEIAQAIKEGIIK